jgi:two-component system OmpR family sensor kinase
MASNQRSSTFRRRLTASMTVLAVGVLAAASLAIYLRVREALLSNFDSALLSIARIEVAGAIDEPGGEVHVHEEIPVLTAPFGLGYEKFAQIKDENHHVRTQTANLAVGPVLETDAERETRALRGEVVFADMRRNHEPYHGIYYPLRDAAGAPLVAVVAIPTRPLHRSLDSLLGALVLALVIGGIAAAFGASRLARRLTRPLEQIATAARTIGGTNLQARIPEVYPDVELREVARVLNDMLARLEAAFVAQRRFVADASHELRSPLANLRGTVEVALRRPRSADEYRDALTISLTEAERLSRLVDDLLTLSRVDANQFALDVCPCDLSDIAHDAVTAHAARSQEKGVQVRLDAQPVPVIGDAHRLRQVVDNLLDNGLRYGPAGSEVIVRTRQEDGHALLSVQDAGPGLSQDDQVHVFDRLYRADASRARDSGGLGLGLPIAKAIVDAHHGHVSVRSEPGEGCLFSVLLPLAPEGV